MSTWQDSLHTPVFQLAPRALDELELLLGGLYAPATGYCLPGTPPAGWPHAFSLSVPEGIADRAAHQGSLLLADSDGTPLAALALDDLGPAIGARRWVAGSLTAMQPAEHPPARHLRLTSAFALRTGLGLPTGGTSTVVAVFDALPRPEDIAEAVTAASTAAAGLVLLAAVTGAETETASFRDLLGSLERCAARVKGASVRVLVLAPPDDGTANAAAVLRAHVLRRLGSETILDFGADSAGRLGDAPGAPRPGAGRVVFFTGLSGSGKSTIARELVQRLRMLDERETTLLDGDAVRQMISAGLGFSRADREMNVRRIGWIAALISKTGGIAVCAPIAPFEETRQQVREMATRVGGFTLVHVSTPLGVCESRDRKGLYAKARAGLIPDFTGIDSPYEIPLDADCTIDTADTGIEEGVEQVLDLLLGRIPEQQV
ncbi:sulfate adenylyltransferase [Arthrobacter sp. CAN_A6]|uniref:adenylyl-sulfate kinase n=1 Tax=Arthrobacter sp. CAN_A6 TaxID=2787721 RepID=UPI0018CA5049